MYVKIFKLGEEEEINVFGTGTHVLGRGPTLQCNDKRVSRNHAALEVTEDNIKLTSTHVNPCFLRAANSKTITILSKDSTSELNDGDSFALLPEDFWFKIKLVAKEEVHNGTKTETNKRLSCGGLEDLPPDKRAKMELNEEDSNVADTSMEENDANVSSTEQDNLATSESINEPKKNQDDSEAAKLDEPDANSADSTAGKEQENQKNKALPEPDENSVHSTAEREDQKNEALDSAEVAQEPNPVESTSEEPEAKEDKKLDDTNTGQNDEAEASASHQSPTQPKPRRERCWYGAECYRKNPVHRQEYTHPGDSDFESDADDNRPSCSYGASCFRKNKLHRQQYKHPPRERPRKKKRSRKKVDRLNAADSQDLRDLDNELFDSEGEDPFIADDDSDEYNEESDDDSDWEDSQEVDEDGGNVKRLLKEANRFVKK